MLKSSRSRKNSGLTAAIAALFVICSPRALCKASLLDPGTLISVESKNGKTIEKYSDGLTVEIWQDGHIKEACPKDDYTMEASIPERYDKDSREYIDNDIQVLLDLAWMHGRQNENDSRVQSRLRQFSSFYLRVHEPTKAEPLAERYLHVQTVLAVKGEPLAFAQRNLGECQLALSKFQVAVPLLKAAAEYYKEADPLSYCTVLNDLGTALLKLNKPRESLRYLEIARKIVRENSFSDLKPKVEKNYRQASKAAGLERPL